MRVGIDLVFIEEVSTSLARFGSLDRIFTQDERANCLRETAKVAPVSLAARFAAKEATLKVLRPNGHAIPWTAIEVRRAQGLGGLEVSLSHDGTYATAVVVAEERGKGRRVE